jgi:hypothetical protein
LPELVDMTCVAAATQPLSLSLARFSGSMIKAGKSWKRSFDIKAHKAAKTGSILPSACSAARD